MGLISIKKRLKKIKQLRNDFVSLPDVIFSDNKPTEEELQKITALYGQKKVVILSNENGIED